MKRCLVTGSQGFVGRYLCDLLLHEGCEVLGVGRSEELPRHFTHFVTVGGEKLRAPLRGLRAAPYRRAPLHELAAVVREFAPDCVFHLAFATHSAAQGDLFRTKIEGTAALLDAIGPTRLVLGSSGGVYGEPRTLPVAETHPCEPADLYGVSKLAAEQVARVKARPIVARIFNVVGPGQTETHVCGRIGAQLASGASELEVGPLHATRDFIDVRDVAAALVGLGRAGQPGEVYNVASGRETAIESLLRDFIELSGRPVRVVRKSGIRTGIARQVADVSKLRPNARPLRDSLSDILRYYAD